MAEVMSSLRMVHIPRTINVHDIKQYPSRSGIGTDVCIIMEYAEGGSLEDEIRKRALQNNPFSEEQLLSFLFQVIEV